MIRTSPFDIKLNKRRPRDRGAFVVLSGIRIPAIDRLGDGQAAVGSAVT